MAIWPAYIVDDWNGTFFSPQHTGLPVLSHTIPNDESVGSRVVSDGVSICGLRLVVLGRLVLGGRVE